MNKRLIYNSSKCEGCTHCTTIIKNKIENIYCDLRDKSWIYGQYIEPCKYYERKDKVNADN